MLRMDSFDESDEFCANCLSLAVGPANGGNEEENLFGSVDGLRHHIVIEKLSKMSSSALLNSEQDDRRMTIKVSDALSKIYNLSYLNLSKDHHDHYTEMDKNMGVCDSCAQALSKLYEGYDELGQLRHENSFVAQSILNLDRMLQQLQSTLQNQSAEKAVITSGVFERSTLNVIIDEDGDQNFFNDVENCDSGGGSPLFPEVEEEDKVTEIDLILMHKMRSPSLPIALSSSLRKEEFDPKGPPWLRVKRLTSTEIASATSSKTRNRRQRPGPKSKLKMDSEIKTRERQNQVKINNDDAAGVFDVNLVKADHDDDGGSDQNFEMGNDDVDEDFIRLDEELSSSAEKKKKSSSSSSRMKNRLTKIGEGDEKQKKRKRKPRMESSDLEQQDDVAVIQKKRSVSKSLPKLSNWSVWKKMIKVENEEDAAHVRNKKPPFKCKVCGKVFNSLSGMRVHALTEMGETPHKCPFPGCSMSFVVYGFLTAHMFTHTSADVECEICHKKFGSPLYLTHHMRSVHDKLRRFLCTKCGKSFYSRGQLKKHEVSHADLQAFSCDTCGAMFKRNQTLIRHVMAVHGGKNFLCTICGQAYRRPDYLSGHMRRKHRD